MRRTKKRKKRAIPKKIRAWYSVYCDQKKQIGEDPYPIKLWAGIEAERFEGTARGKILARFCNS